MLLIGKGPSARALRLALSLPRVKIEGGRVLARVPERYFRRSGKTRYRWLYQTLEDRQPVICWGQPLSQFERPEWCDGCTLNERIVSDKLSQLSRFWQARNIPIPVFACSYRDNAGVFTVPGGVRGGDWLARKRYHFGGHDIVGPMDFDHLTERLLSGQSDYGVQVVDKSKEWRVHTFRGETLRIARKMPREGAGVVWNQANSHFRYDVGLREETHQELCRLGRDAVAALGMDFGAADIIRDKEGRCYVLEVNSAPGIADNNNTLMAYVEAIQEWANGR